MNWRRYLREDLPRPTQADREALERLVGRKLPDLYWEVVSEHQGERADPQEITTLDGQQVSAGVFLHVLDPERVPAPDDLYGVRPLYSLVSGRWSPDFVPFTDDTGGNYLAFDYRVPGAGGESSVVFLDHELEEEPQGVVPVAASFAALMALLEQAREPD